MIRDVFSYRVRLGARVQIIMFVKICNSPYRWYLGDMTKNEQSMTRNHVCKQ